jgi:Fe-S cluster biogenesis protein NfuA
LYDSDDSCTEGCCGSSEAPVEGDVSAAVPVDGLHARVGAVIDEIRPYLQADGGDIELVSIDANVVYVRLVGACHGCPRAMMTLRMGVERRIREVVPEVEGVELAG